MSASPQSPVRPTGAKIAWLLVALLVVAAYGMYQYFAKWKPVHDENALEDASLEEISAIAAREPNNPRALYHLGMRLLRKPDRGPSYKAFSRAAELAPNDEQIWVQYVGVTNTYKGPTAAFKVMDDYMKLHPNSTKMKSEHDSLLVSIQKAADGFRTHVPPDYKDAATFYKIWLAEDPGSEQAKRGLAETEKAMGTPNGTKAN